jgi:hypothetical protein
MDAIKNMFKSGKDAAVPERVTKVMSLLNADDIARLNGIPPQAAAAAYRGDEPPPQLSGNPSFIALMHDVIGHHAPLGSDMQLAAREQGEGYMYVIDAATPNGISGAVPPQDIIGAFKVERGAVVAGSYEANPRYVVFRQGRGLVRLPGKLHSALIEQLRALPPVER